MSDDQPSNGRISVSEDKLYRALAEFENNLKEWLEEKLERKADLVLLSETRRTVSKMDDRLIALERFRYAIPSVSLLAAIAAIVETMYLILR